MTDLADIKRRVRIEGDCWHWFGACTARGVPLLYSAAPNRTSLSTRRAIYERIHGVKLGPKQFATYSCDDAQCVAPDHILICTRRRYMQLAEQRGTVYRDARTRAKISVAKRARSDIDMAIARTVRVLRQAGVPGVEVARRFNISPDRVCLIFKNKQWQEPLGPLALLAQQAGML